eukprot:279194-Prorocentrum_lima.AAC.1
MCIRDSSIFFALIDANVPPYICGCCGAWGITKPIGLRGACKGTPSLSGRKAISCVLSGRVPKSKQLLGALSKWSGL